MAKSKRWSEKNLRSPWERILLASETGTGCRLSAEDCYQLSFDDAIMTRAEMDRAERRGEEY